MAGPAFGIDGMLVEGFDLSKSAGGRSSLIEIGAARSAHGSSPDHVEPAASR
jgi:hypothetical protein